MRAAITLALCLLIGCAAQPYEPRLAADHPANPAAPTMPLPPPSPALADSTAQASPSGDPLADIVPTQRPDAHAGHGAHEHHDGAASPATKPADGGHHHE